MKLFKVLNYFPKLSFLRDDSGALIGVVEEKDASEFQRKIREVNTGVLASPAGDLREYLPRVNNDNSQGEYYLPDILALAVGAGRKDILPGNLILEGSDGLVHRSG